MDAESTATQREIITSIAFYSLCSSLMLVVNKMAMALVPVAALVNMMQLVSCTVFVTAISHAGLVPVDKLIWDKVQPYMVYVLAFAAGIYCNLKALEGSNIETVIVFRSCTPVVVSGLDFLLLGRELPSQRSMLALGLIALGATGYVMTDNAFRVAGVYAYSWVVIYFALLCFQMTYGKILLETVALKSTWGSVYYTNLLSIPPTLALGFVLGDYARLKDVVWSTGAALAVFMSCVCGIGIGYSGWHCRSKVTATSYTLVGVMNKLFTVLVSSLIWDSSSSVWGVGCLLVCIAGGALYEQAPLRLAPKLLPQSSRSLD